MVHTKFDRVMNNLVDYAYEQTTSDNDAIRMAHFCLLESIGCAIAASSDADFSSLMNSVQFSKNSQGIPIIDRSLWLRP